MSPMTFPRMFVSRGEGWNWLMRIHPSPLKLYLFYAVPLSIIPPAMVFYAWTAYRQTLLTEVSLVQALTIVAVFFVAELVAVPLMALAIQRIGHIAELVPTYTDAFALAAVAPTPLWIMPLFLFIPSLLANVLALAAAMFGAGVLIYQGVSSTYYVEDEGRARLLAGSVIAAGLVGWAAMMLLTLVTWGIVLL